VYESVDRPSAAIKVLESASREGHPFALAMLAFNMPRMDGMGLLREIRERQALDELRIVVLAPGRLDVEEFSDRRVSQVLKKPAAQSLIYEAAAGSLSRTAPGVERAAAIETASSALSQLILVVEDNEINRTVVTALLNKLGLQVAVARNGREAIEMAGEHDYDAILMDCLMPEIDGFQATRQIREDEGALHVPIVAMTALSMPGDRERCFAAGMDDYLSKPIRGTALEAVIERWLPTERSRAGTEAVGDGDAGASSPVEGVLDRPAITRLRDTLTPTACRQLLEIFDEQQEKCVTDITDAVTRGDREEVRRVAHLLKGSSATLGATSLRLCCERLEHIDATQPREVTEAQLVELRRVAAESNDALRAQLI
jgi:CheY-like chemotaxis protein/HPt (histidine-containing phosphotransfer) domain-containing protein